jgi:hypothetical protein
LDERLSDPLGLVRGHYQETIAPLFLGFESGESIRAQCDFAGRGKIKIAPVRERGI